jgi:HK97 family phage major capsid protein
MASLTELREEIAAKRKALHDIFTEAGSDLDMSRVTCITGTTEQKAAEIKRLNLELSDLGTQEERLSLMEQIGRQNATEYKRLTEPATSLPLGKGGSGPDADSPFAMKAFQPGRLREHLQTNKAYRAFRDDVAREASFEIPILDIKTLVTLSTINRQAERRDPVAMALEDRTVADLMLQSETGTNTIEYYEETTFTNAADTVAEGDTKPESAIGYTLRTESVRKIGHFIPATKEAMDDIPFLESQLRGRMAFGVVRKEESQLLSGNGTAPNLRGLLNRTGIQTQAKGTDPTPDAIYRAMQKVRGAAGAGFAEPTAVVLHPNDWTDIKLLRTADGIYIWGNPSDEGPDRIWGKMVRQTTAMPEGTGLVGAFRPYAEVVRREGITITLSTEHSTFWAENKVGILAEERLALLVTRPSAFATITGI